MRSKLLLASGVVGLLFSALAPQRAAATRSITACDPETWYCGTAVVTNPYGISFMVPQGAPFVAVANQGIPDIVVGRAIIQNVEAGMDADAALAAALQVGSWPEYSQLGVTTIAPTAPWPGTPVSVATYTGAAVLESPETCLVRGPTYVVIANSQTSPGVCEAMASAFEASAGEIFARRLLKALVAGAAVGGDVRGEYSASIRLHAGYDTAWWAYPNLLYPMAADVAGSLTWAADLRWALEVWQAQYAWPVAPYLDVSGDPRELVPFTDLMQKGALKQLRELGYYNGPVGRGWSGEAEQALAAWEARQILFPKPTVVDGGRLMIEQSVAVLLLEGRSHNILIPAPDADDPSHPRHLRGGPRRFPGRLGVGPR